MFENVNVRILIRVSVYVLELKIAILNFNNIQFELQRLILNSFGVHSLHYNIFNEYLI